MSAAAARSLAKDTFIYLLYINMLAPVFEIVGSMRLRLFIVDNNKSNRLLYCYIGYSKEAGSRNVRAAEHKERDSGSEISLDSRAQHSSLLIDVIGPD